MDRLVEAVAAYLCRHRSVGLLRLTLDLTRRRLDIFAEIGAVEVVKGAVVPPAPGAEAMADSSQPAAGLAGMSSNSSTALVSPIQPLKPSRCSPPHTARAAAPLTHLRPTARPQPTPKASPPPRASAAARPTAALPAPHLPKVIAYSHTTPSAPAAPRQLLAVSIPLSSAPAA